MIDRPAWWVRTYYDRDGDVWDLYDNGMLVHAKTYSVHSPDQRDWIMEQFGLTDEKPAAG